jgi:hypothetical protein
MSWTIAGKYVRASATDPDAQAYLQAVEAADGQALEFEVARAIDNFVLGCKADGIWPAIKASCILAGARTLNGALVPLVGTAPTNFNFVSGDYNRKTGLVGNGSTKYLNSNRNNNADPQNSKHLAVYFDESIAVTATFRSHLGMAPQGSQIGASIISTDPSSSDNRYRINGTTVTVIAAGTGAGFKGASRSNSTQIITRHSKNNTTSSASSETPANGNLFIFARNVPGGFADAYSNARLAFYSIGESLDLALLDARVTTLINAYAAAIP